MVVSCEGNLLPNESVLSKWRDTQVPVPSSGDITEFELGSLKCESILDYRPVSIFLRVLTGL
jgi:hypothetical protein